MMPSNSSAVIICLSVLMLLDSGPRTVYGQEPEFAGRTLSAWAIMAKEDPIPRKRRAALVALGQIASQSDQSDVLKQVMAVVGRAVRTDANSQVRQQAALILGQQKVEIAVLALTDLVEAMRVESDPNVRRDLANTLARFGPLAKSAIPPLLDSLKHESPPALQAAAADALGRIGSEARSAIPQLLRLAEAKDTTVRQAVMFALGRIEPEDPQPSAAILIRALTSDPEPTVRREALVSLGFLGDRSEPVVAAIAEVLSSDDVNMRRQAMLTLGKFGSAVRAVAPILIRSFREDSDSLVRMYAIQPLRQALGTAPRELIRLLGNRLTGPGADPAFEVRIAICEELGSLSPAEKELILPLLREARRDSQLKVRDAATQALRQLEQPVKDTPKTP
jgi:HEAT repeat protein